MKTAFFFRFIAIVVFIPLLCLVYGCAGTQLLVYEQQLLVGADSLFAAGNYEVAKLRYTKIRDNFPATNSAAQAQYQLGYINVFYNNPFASMEAALREFKRFATTYAQHPRIEEVNSWIRLLVALETFQNQYDAKAAQALELQKKEKATRQQQSSGSYDVLLEAVRRCYSEKDSLIHQIQVLHEVIEGIEAKSLEKAGGAGNNAKQDSSL